MLRGSGSGPWKCQRRRIARRSECSTGSVWKLRRKMRGRCRRCLGGWTDWSSWRGRECCRAGSWSWRRHRNLFAFVQTGSMCPPGFPHSSSLEKGYECIRKGLTHWRSGIRDCLLGDRCGLGRPVGQLVGMYEQQLQVHISRTSVSTSTTTS